MSPTVNDLKKSNFLTKNDVEPPVLVTITGYEEMNMAKEGQPPEMKWCLNFKEFDKPLSLNVTNGNMLAVITGSEDFNAWINKQVVLYNDPTISFGNEITGGIRIRATITPQQQLTAQEMKAKLDKDSINNEQTVQEEADEVFG